MIAYLLAVVAILVLIAAKIVTSPRRKRTPHQHGVPNANNIYDLARRARRKSA